MVDETDCGTDKDALNGVTDIAGTQYDAAKANWGGKWRMPTHEQQEELLSECYWVWTDNYNNSDVAGYIVYKADEKETIIYGDIEVLALNYTVSGSYKPSALIHTLIEIVHDIFKLDYSVVKRLLLHHSDTVRLIPASDGTAGHRIKRLHLSAAGLIVKNAITASCRVEGIVKIGEH